MVVSKTHTMAGSTVWCGYISLASEHFMWPLIRLHVVIRGSDAGASPKSNSRGASSPGGKRHQRVTDVPAPRASNSGGSRSAQQRKQQQRQQQAQTPQQQLGIMCFMAATPKT